MSDKGLFSQGIANRFAALQFERCLQQTQLMKNLQKYVPLRKITRMERVRYWICSKRVALAKWIAGDDWPDEY